MYASPWRGSPSEIPLVGSFSLQWRRFAALARSGAQVKHWRIAHSVARCAVLPGILVIHLNSFGTVQEAPIGAMSRDKPVRIRLVVWTVGCMEAIEIVRSNRAEDAVSSSCRDDESARHRPRGG